MPPAPVPPQQSTACGRTRSGGGSGQGAGGTATGPGGPGMPRSHLQAPMTRERPAATSPQGPSSVTCASSAFGDFTKLLAVAVGAVDSSPGSARPRTGCRSSPARRRQVRRDRRGARVAQACRTSRCPANPAPAPQRSPELRRTPPARGSEPATATPASSYRAGSSLPVPRSGSCRSMAKQPPCVGQTAKSRCQPRSDAFDLPRRSPPDSPPESGSRTGSSRPVPRSGSCRSMAKQPHCSGQSTKSRCPPKSDAFNLPRRSPTDSSVAKWPGSPSPGNG